MPRHSKTQRLIAFMGRVALPRSCVSPAQAQPDCVHENYGSMLRRAQSIGLAADEPVARLREQLMPLVKQFHRLTRESIEAIGRMRQAPSSHVERDRAIEIVLM
jgi:hypothetical protein